MLYFMGNIMLFMSIYMSIQWFAYSAYKNVFSSFTHVILNISKNSAYSFLSYPLWKKYKNV
jgi:hypothetical protein